MYVVGSWELKYSIDIFYGLDSGGIILICNSHQITLASWNCCLLTMEQPYVRKANCPCVLSRKETVHLHIGPCEVLEPHALFDLLFFSPLKVEPCLTDRSLLHCVPHAWSPRTYLSWLLLADNKINYSKPCGPKWIIDMNFGARECLQKHNLFIYCMLAQINILGQIKKSNHSPQ
jgi:hypothetical protein